MRTFRSLLDMQGGDEQSDWRRIDRALRSDRAGARRSPASRRWSAALSCGAVDAAPRRRAGSLVGDDRDLAPIGVTRVCVRDMARIGMTRACFCDLAPTAMTPDHIGALFGYFQ